MNFMAINMTFTDFVTPVPADWLNNVNFVVNNPTVTSYTAPFTGSVTRTNTSKYSDTVSVLDFGADRTGNLDSSAAFQAAFNTGRMVYAPGGSYKLSPTLNTTGPGLYGDGQNSTILITTANAGADLITWTGTGSTIPLASNGPIFHDFTINAPINTGTGGYLIHLLPSVGEISFVQCYNVTFVGGFVQFGGLAWSHSKIHDNNFSNYYNAGLFISNNNVFDSGDSAVYGNLFSCGFNGSATQAGIQHISSAGTKIFGNKFLGGNFGYLMNADITGGGLGGVYITSNSIENMTIACIQLSRSSTTGNWGGIVIANNEMGFAPNVLIANTSGFTSNVNVTGNVFTQIPASGAGIIFDTHFDWSISDNKFEGSNTGTVGITTGSSYTSLHIGINSYNQMATPVSIGRPSQTTMDLTPQVAATINVTTSTAYGSLFSGNSTITWPTAFKIAPTSFSHNITSAGAGGITVLVTAATTTGASITVIGVVNGGSVPVSITGFGIA
jgi:hypothetical protein